jgi:hypothetical protein
MKGIIACVVLGVMLVSCASVGNESLRHESEATVGAKITCGVTTQTQIKQMFGSPMTTTYTDGGLMIYKYELSKMSADAVSYIPIVGWFGGSASGKKRELVVMFDENDVVKRFNMSESKVSQKTGVFNH